MQLEEIQNSKILFTVLNWGIGHASRSISIIQKLLSQGNEIILMSDGEAAELLKSSFPSLIIEYLPSYQISYSPKGLSKKSILSLILSTYKGIRNEKKYIQHFLKNNLFDYIISDNRYGTFHSTCINIIITHQLQLISSFSIIQFISKKIIQNFIEKFDYIWVPDIENSLLTGNMSLPEFNIPKIYIGLHSHLKIRKHEPLSPPYHLVLISGPMPSRERLATKFIELISKNLKIHYILVAGDFKAPMTTYIDRNLHYFSKLESEKLQEIVCGASKIYCRSGYSTLVDLYLMGIRNICCIPTPNQYEQEYLADYFLEKGFIKEVMRLGV